MNVVQRSRRSLRVVRTAGSIFAGYRWRAWRSRHLSRDEAERRLSPYHRRCAQRVLETATALQGLMIKVGQMIGARADIFPDEYIEVLSQLHDTVPPRPFATIRAAVERELGTSIEERFAEFSPAPIAAASLSQVHRGRLRDGADALDALLALFPGGTITGVPKVRACEIIGELEPVARGPYTGSLGYLSANGASDWNLMIRTLVAVGKEGRVSVGAGVVADSDPAREFEETLAKASHWFEVLGWQPAA
jgi:hypothetical protein